MQIFQALLDRHQNQVILNNVSVKIYSALSIENPSRSDIIFTHKHGSNIMQALVDALSIDDKLDGLVACYNTAALMIAEMTCSETIQEFILFILGIQQVAVAANDLSNIHKVNLQAISISLLALLGRCTGISTIMEYADKIIECRQDEAHYLLPPLIDPEIGTTQSLNSNIPTLLIDKLALAECLQNSGLEYNRVQTGNPYSQHQTENFQHRQSWVDTSIGGGSKGSNSDLNSNSNDIDSVSSSPGLQRVSTYNFERFTKLNFFFGFLQ